MRAKHPGSFQELTLALLSIAVLLQGCNAPFSSSKDGESKSSTIQNSSSEGMALGVGIISAPQAASGPTSGSAFVAAQIEQEVNAPLNASPTYALVPEDLSLLQAQGLLTADDSVALQQLVKQP